MNDIHAFNPLWGSWEVIDEEPLGAGSCGAVWRARRIDGSGAPRFAAVKFISLDDAADPDRAMATFQTEAAVMRMLKGHPHIVSCEDQLIIPRDGSAGGGLFLRMELLTSLPERLRRAPLRVSDVVCLGRDMAGALSALNACGYAHGDIKPQNIFVDEAGRYKLGDFGTVRPLGGVPAKRRGTPVYMAPETERGEATTPASDIYSLGLVMYRLTNGNRLPFLPPGLASVSEAMRDAALARRQSGETLPAPAYVDGPLAAVILKACAFRPRDRYASGEELLAALRALPEPAARRPDTE